MYSSIERDACRLYIAQRKRCSMWSEPWAKVPEQVRQHYRFLAVEAQSFGSVFVEQNLIRDGWFGKVPQR